ncbi:UDP-glucose--hexose-1-phosphate uridylyltransferase [Tenacibaculum halocynthiae]|uniref:UDP-glucose--hexose-1-phosphate uridylyltransferase n=1 Tax=Tenacibaculum halocynthiae TaxID=1254437 RepID=UPI003892FF37
MESDLEKYSHKRYNILTGEWVLVSPHRAKRPWQGKEETIVEKEKIIHDSNCYLCAGNTRINGEKNPDYKDVFVFTNDFGALQSSTPKKLISKGLLKAELEQGICKVICFSPDHSKTLANMEIEEIVRVIRLWQEEFVNLSKKKGINYIQIFENKGEVMGCSNSHPHGQIWGQATIPNEVVKKNREQFKYFKENNRILLVNYLNQELKENKRILYENQSFVLLVPFWAVWPFETMIIPKKHQSTIADLTNLEQTDFAEVLLKITKGYDKLFQCSFPYSSGIHQAPISADTNEYWQWHMSFYPPLLRSASIKKFMVGYEMFGMPQRDITAEEAFERLKNVLY